MQREDGAEEKVLMIHKHTNILRRNHERVHLETFTPGRFLKGLIGF